MQKPSEALKKTLLEKAGIFVRTNHGHSELSLAIVHYLIEIIPQLQNEIKSLRRIIDTKYSIDNSILGDYQNKTEKLQNEMLKKLQEPKYTCPNCWRSDLNKDELIESIPETIGYIALLGNKPIRGCKYCANEDKK